MGKGSSEAWDQEEAQVVFVDGVQLMKRIKVTNATVREHVRRFGIDVREDVLKVLDTHDWVSEVELEGNVNPNIVIRWECMTCGEVFVATITKLMFPLTETCEESQQLRIKRREDANTHYWKWVEKDNGWLCRVCGEFCDYDETEKAPYAFETCSQVLMGSRHEIN